ncbi:MAG TPA: allophanate hydrolase, partial [Humisphaera sp.]
HVWISRTPAGEISQQLKSIEDRRRAGERLPLFGVPVAVKDSLDVAGLPTTLACPDFAYTPDVSAFAVKRLTDAGAIVVGKTNLDQFATGLVGARSPYGACRSVFGRDLISGGSSSGSAVAVAANMVPLAVATDTAGSGRVPAMFNNIVGHKPTRGLISAAGLVPACQSIDCVTVMALTCRDAAEMAAVMAGYDEAYPYSRRVAVSDVPASVRGGKFTFGRPADGQLEFFGNAAYAAAWRAAIETARRAGGTEVVIDFAPFLEAGRLLYVGPWVAERVVALGRFWETNRDSLFPVTRKILEGAAAHSAVGTFDAMHKLAALRRRAEAELRKADVLLMPTAGTTYTVPQVEADPVRTNSNLGYYTTFANLLDLSALAIPAGFTADGLPFGVTLVADAGGDATLYAVGSRLEAAADLPAGGTGTKPHRAEAIFKVPAAAPTAGDVVQVAVVGAHLSGLPLNHQLTDAGGRLVRAAVTAPFYRFYALPGTVPPKPGMVRSPERQATGIELEVWELSAAAFGRFVAAIPPPLGIGSVELADGAWVKCFLCEPHAVAGAAEITSLGGWRAYMASRGK